MTNSAIGDKAMMNKHMFNKMPAKEWDGVALLYSHVLDQYFNDMDNLNDYCKCEHSKISELQIVICEPEYAQPLDVEYFCDQLPEDGELPYEIEVAIDEFNKKVESYGKPLSWQPGDYALKLKD